LSITQSLSEKTILQEALIHNNKKLNKTHMNTVTLGEKEINVLKIVDAKDVFCPMPLLRTKKEMTSLMKGQVLQIDITDPNSKTNIQGWCQRSENTYLGEKIYNNFISVFIKKS